MASILYSGKSMRVAERLPEEEALLWIELDLGLRSVSRVGYLSSGP